MTHDDDIARSLIESRPLRSHHLIKLTIRFDQLIKTERTIPPARIRQNPNSSTLHTSRLQPPSDLSLTRKPDVRRLTQKGNKVWLIARNLLLEFRGGSGELRWRKLICTRCRSFHYRRHTVSVLEYCAILLRRNFLRGEAREMQHAPVAIISSREMVSGRGRCHARVDPAEQHLETFGNDVGKLVSHGRPRKVGEGTARCEKDSILSTPTHICVAIALGGHSNGAFEQRVAYRDKASTFD